MKVAIWGSCATRDAFETRAHAFSDIDYFARSSWIAQASPTPARATFGAGLTGGFRERVVREDIDRSILDQVVGGDPDLVVLDLIDERFAVVDPGHGTWVTNSGYFAKSPQAKQLRDSKAPRMSKWGPEREAVFAASVERLAGRFAELPPTTPIVLHSAWYTPFVAEGTGSFGQEGPARAAANNELLQRLAGHVVASLGERLLVFQPRKEVLRADPGHRWGLAMYHYENGYYDDLLDALEAVVRGDGHPQVERATPPVAPAHIARWASEWSRSERASAAPAPPPSRRRGFRRLAPDSVARWYRARRPDTDRTR